MKHGVAEYKDGKDMFVWDIPGCTPIKARVILIYPDETCLALDADSITGQKRWIHYRPIPEKKMRLMTRDEMVIKVCNSDKMAIRWRCGKWHPKAFHGISGDLSEYEWCDTSSGTFGPPQKFEVEE